MKYRSMAIALMVLLLNVNCTAGEPQRQKVYSIVKQQQPLEWYKTQARLWKEFLDEHPKDGDGWLNYYTANRMLKLLDAGKTQDDLDAIIRDMEQAIPDSFEFHYITYWNAGASESSKTYHHLKRAHELAPDRPETFDDFMNHYELTRDKQQLKVIAQKWFESNDISPGIYAWNHNMLVSCDQGAILLTAGDNDTYPALVLQQAKDLRKDISVMNIYLLMVDEYRDKYFAELDIPKMTRGYHDFEKPADFQTALCRHLRENSRRPVYLSIAFSPALYKPFEDSLYNVGMALKWNSEKFDNIAVIKKNYEKHYLTDYLRMDLGNDISQGVVHHMSANYLVSMLTLYNHYVESEDARAGAFRNLIERVAANANMSEEVARVLNER